MKNNRFLNYFLMAFAIIMLVFTFIRILSPETPPIHEPPIKPATSPFVSRIAGIGVVEPLSEFIEVSTSVAGIVSKVFVTAGQEVKANQPLFQIDDREANARLQSAQAHLATAKIDYKDKQDQFSLYQRITDRRAISEDEFNRRRFALEAAAARVQEAQAEINLRATQLELLTVKAPIDGQILKVNIRSGEFARAGTSPTPLICMGNTQTLTVRVEIDETDALRLNPQAAAVAKLRGDAHTIIPLKYLRTEPLVMPKRSTNNTPTQLIDTRVLQVIYEIAAPSSLKVGQQVDVFIEVPTTLPAEVK